MKAATLNQPEKKPALKAFVWGIIIAAVFIVPSMVIDKGMYLYYGDFNVQVIPFYQLMSDAVKSGNVNWNWYTDLGTSFVGGYSFYNLGSPFFWLMVPFPTDWIPYLLGPLTILKFGLCSLNAYLFLQRYAKDKNNAVIGAMLYAFSGFAIYSMVFHFIDSLVFFPLLMAALDGFIYENKRGRFAVMAAVCAIVNYYFFVGEAVFCIIYWAVKMASKDYRMTFKRVLFLALEAVMGVGAALFMLLPSLYHILGNSRVSNVNMSGLGYWIYENPNQYAEILISLFMPPEIPSLDVYVPDFESSWAAITGYLPLFSMSGVFAIIFNKNKNKWIRCFYAVCAVFMFVPVLNSSFQMFTETKYVRWFFMMLLIMSLGSVVALEDQSTRWKKAIITNFLIVLVITLAIGFTPQTQEDAMKKLIIGIEGSSMDFWFYTAVAFLNILLCALFISLYNRNRKAFKKYGSLILSCAIIITMGNQYVVCKISGEKYVNIVEEKMLNGGDNIHIEDIQNWRTDVVTYSAFTTLKYDKDSVESYDYPQLEEIADDYLENNVVQNDLKYYSDDDNLTMFWRIPGLECFHSTINGSIMDLHNCFDFERTTLSNWPLGMYGVRSLFSVKYIVNHEDTALTIENEEGEINIPGWKYYDTQNDYIIYENENVLPIGFTFNHFMLDSDFRMIPTQYKHIAALDAMVVSSDEDAEKCLAAGMTRTYSDDYDFTEEEYFRFCNDRKELTCSDFARDNKGFEAKIDTKDSDEWVFFSVPYDKGWKAEVNGERSDIMNVYYGLMAVKVPANTHGTIRFDYRPYGMAQGCVCSAVFLALLIGYVVLMKKKQDSFDDGSSDKKTEVFDAVKKLEEKNMMNVYKRVPIVLESGSGSEAYDINNKKYIDFTSGIGVNALGFSNVSWVRAVEKQIETIQHASNIYYNTVQIQLAELLCIKTGFSKVFFANSGAEANECAIKLARKYGSDKYGEKRTHIVTLENSFHGRTITTLSATGQEEFHKDFAPFTEGFSYAKANDMESVKSAVTNNTCAVMIELVQGEGGVNPLDKDFVSELQKFCQERDILLIVDEIQTGIGRTGKLFCFENYDITPDVITSAKALGGGLPLSACLCSEKLKDVMTVGTNGTTFGGNTIACAGAMKILEIVSEEDFLESVREKGEYLSEKIRQMDGVKEVRGLGMMLGIVLEKDNAAEVQQKCAENGLLVLTAKNAVRLLPPLNIDYYDINEGLAVLEKVIGGSL